MKKPARKKAVKRKYTGNVVCNLSTERCRNLEMMFTKGCVHSHPHKHKGKFNCTGAKCALLWVSPSCQNLRDFKCIPVAEYKKLQKKKKG